MYGPIKKVAEKSGYTENNAGPIRKNLKPVPEDKKDNVGTFPEHVRARMGFMRMKDGSEAPDGPAKGFPRFCGGMSKPYKRK